MELYLAEMGFPILMSLVLSRAGDRSYKDPVDALDLATLLWALR